MVIGGAIALASGVVIESLRGQVKRKNIAKALYFEICTIERALAGLVPLARTTLERADHPAIIPQELYPSRGLYFAFQADIADFGADLSDRLYAFYTRLVEAEHERILILNSINQSIVKRTVIDSARRLCQAIIDLSGGLGPLKAALAGYAR
ncbi:MAG: hypothetical protein ACP5C4_01670 [Methanomicrobiales archaeon]